MIIVRPIQENDIDNLLALAEAAYPGMTTLPPDLDVLTNKIERATASINKIVSEPKDETYLLVMEDIQTHKLVGTAGIIARLGEDDQFYSYKLNKVTHSSRDLNKRVNAQTLHLSNHFEGFAEVATLFLLESYRNNGNGKLLARSRYLFMAQFRERFPKQVMADLRGYFDEQGNSPFWEAVGNQFFNMTYAEADLFGAINGNQFIADLMPNQPIYVNLLPAAAQAVIGRPNDQGIAALAMLEKEGFHWNSHVDIFDGAPSVDAYIDELATLKNNQVSAFIGCTDSSALTTRYLVSSGTVDSFVVCISALEKSDDGIRLPQQTVNALQLSVGDDLRYVPL